MSKREGTSAYGFARRTMLTGLPSFSGWMSLRRPEFEPEETSLLEMLAIVSRAFSPSELRDRAGKALASSVTRGRDRGVRGTTSGDFMEAFENPPGDTSEPSSGEEPSLR
jgi:hypothetical protein